jgi:DNA-binding NarL/FixJ family response regulator
MTTIRVLLADDQSLVLAGLKTILEVEPDIEVVATAANGEEAVSLACQVVPDVVLMDIRMPGLDGIAATRQITARLQSTRVVILTTFDVDEHVYEALRAGATGFLVKDLPDDQIAAAVRGAARGEELLAPSVTRRLIAAYTSRPRADGPPEGATHLTRREFEVWQLIAKGLSNHEIATALVVGEATVKTHVARVLTKLGARDRIQAVVLAYECGVPWDT